MDTFLSKNSHLFIIACEKFRLQKQFAFLSDFTHQDNKNLLELIYKDLKTYIWNRSNMPSRQRSDKNVRSYVAKENGTLFLFK